MTKKVKRLYEQFQPRHYILDLAIDKEKMVFSGQVIIAGQKIGRPSQRLTFHQSGLKIKNVHVVRHDRKGDQEQKIERLNTHKAYEEVRLHSKAMLYPGSYTIRLEFSGKITRQMNGIYPCLFEYKGKQEKLIATQFESHHAREVFPCIDEPEAKATFDLSLITKKGEVVLSNTPVKTEETEGKLTTTSFETTPKMSTYLLAFVIGKLSYKEAKTKDGVVVRAYATPDNVGSTDFALETAVKCLEFYNDYFAIPYPLAKCDFVALPDFASGAMENWGVITFREQALLVDPKNSTLASKQYVALVVAHELTHQWFGNLVTMRWWTDLWLNEGFASWMEYLAVDHLYPDWHVWTQFLVDEQQQALKLDALEHTHPIEVTVNHPDEIRTIFDAISYSKGASVIHMLEKYLGHDVFQGGLRHYLNKHQYANTDTVDLWASLEEVSGKPVKEFMQAWTTQPGFPLLAANISDNQISLGQSRFFANPAHKKLPDQLWPVPLQALTPEIPATLEASHKDFRVPETRQLKFNVGQSGFYRVAYNATQLERLGDQIQKGHMQPEDRLGIISDLFENAKAGSNDTVDALHFLSHFAEEDNYAVWDTIAGAIGSLRLTMDDEALRDDMKPFILHLVASQLKRLGWQQKKTDSHFDKLLRPIILSLAANSDEAAVVKQCFDLFKKIKHPEDVAPELRVTASPTQVKRGIDIDPDLRGTVFGTVARLGGKTEFDKLVALHNNSTHSEERTTLTAAITGFKQPELIKRALAMITSDNVRLQDVAYWIAYSFMNRYAKKLAWQWTKQNWGWLEENLGTDLSFYRMPIYTARVFSEKSFIKEYKGFFKPRLSIAFERSYNQGLELLDIQIAWKERALKEVKTFFKNQS